MAERVYCPHPGIARFLSISWPSPVGSGEFSGAGRKSLTKGLISQSLSSSACRVSTIQNRKYSDSVDASHCFNDRALASFEESVGLVIGHWIPISGSSQRMPDSALGL